jgi:hypothetical protein
MKERKRRVKDMMGGREKHLSCLLLFLFFTLLMAGCGHRYPPERPDNICEIFRERRNWYKKADVSSRRWGIPIPVIMAIMHQESAYQARIKPPRTAFLWVFPGRRPSSAYGYAQATESTWD